MKSLRIKMTAMIVLVVLISSGLLSLMSYKRARTSMISQLETNYSVEADKYARELAAWVNTNATVIDTLAAEIEESGIYSRGYDAFHKYLSEICSLLNKNGFFYDIYFTYPDNTMACASDFVVDGTVDYVHGRDWFYTAAESRELFYSTPYLDSDSGKPIITISRAVYTGNTLQGVLAADIFVDVLVDIISQADIAAGGYAFLVDRNMGMIVHPNDAYAFGDTPHGVMEIPDAPYAEVISKILSGSRETVYLQDYDGVVRGIVVSRMENTGWYVGIATSKDELMRSVNGLTRGFLIAAAIAVVIGGLIAVFLAYEMDRHSKEQQAYEAHVLRLEKQAADEASQAKSRFLADMSHEIRTPINAMLGMNEMILRETDSRDILKYSMNIRQSGHYLLHLVNSILDFSKIEDGKMEIMPVRYNLRTQIDYFSSSIAEKARAKSLDFRLAVDPSLPSGLYGDDIRISQVVMNLLTNAVKYTEKGSVTLAIREKERKTAEGKASVLLYVEVRDTGIGIREDDMKRLFESFERLDVIRNRSIEGTGLGLSIAARLLELMGSELKAESTYGVGSVFCFELWQEIEDETPVGSLKQGVPESPDPVVYNELFHAPTARILVVDDTRINLLVVASLLKKTDILIDTALSGPEAVTLAGKNAYDVILMDQRMPDMDGTEATRRIRSQENGPNRNTPVICLTADVIVGAKERYLLEGFTDYLPKPIDSLELEQMLKKHLPPEKVNPPLPGEESPVQPGSAADTGDGYALLRTAGLDPAEGLRYCRQDDALYRSLLQETIRSVKEKAAGMEDYYQKKDWKNYAILVHSLKSSSRMIGASALSEIAAAAEKAANIPDSFAVESIHPRLMAQYEATVSALRLVVPEQEESPADDSGILEFPPE